MVKWITVMDVEFRRPRSPNASVSLLWIFVVLPWVGKEVILLSFWIEAGRYGEYLNEV